MCEGAERRERVLIIGAEFSILYTSVSASRGRVSVCLVFTPVTFRQIRCKESPRCFAAPHLPGNLGGGKGSGSKRLICRNRAAGRFRAPRGEITLLLPPRHSQTFTRARRHGGTRGIGSECEIHSAREEGHDTDCIKYRRSARMLPLESPARGCSGSKFLCAPGPAVQGRSSRAPSPARPSLDLDHARCFTRDVLTRFPSLPWGREAGQNA